MNFDPPDDNIGIDPRARIATAGVDIDPIEILWATSMAYEAEFMRRVVESGKPQVLKFSSRELLDRQRLRFYRCKKILMDQGNRYVRALTFPARGNLLRIDFTDDPSQFIISDEQEAERLWEEAEHAKK